jgi:hypothetical protein
MALACLLVLGSRIGPPKGFCMQEASLGAGIEFHKTATAYAGFHLKEE